VSRTRTRSLLARIGDALLAAAILGLLVLLAARLDRVETRTTMGAAVIKDGDSLTIGNERIRLRGIDAPEYGQVCHRDGAGYRCGQLSRAALQALIGDRAVSCDGWERDRYGRLLARCRAGEVDLNRAQVSSGWAVAFGDFEDEERVAREARLGIWSGSFDMPRHWRDTHGGLAEAGHDWTAAVFNALREIFRFF
jgi:endonuclease YncB( thermonuclease family)